MSFFLKPLLITVFIRHVALAERSTTALLISVHLCELGGYGDALYRLSSMDI